MSKSKFVKHIPCDECGSSDANSLFDDGHTHCFVCETTKFPNDKKKEHFPIKEFRALTDRRISEATARHFGVTAVVEDGVITQHHYPYFNRDGKPCAEKKRFTGDKSFAWSGDVKGATLFGQQLWDPGSAKTITLVEGECDAMAVFEIMGKWPVVSVHSAGQAPRNVAENFEYLNSFENVVICFDADEPKINPKTGETHYPGQEAALKVAAMFPIGKAKVLTLKEAKDPNDYLMKGKQKAFSQEWWNAPTYTPTGIKLGKDMWDEISKEESYETVLYPWKGLNDKTYGIRLSEATLIVADTGVGKTSVLSAIEYQILNDEEIKKKGYGIGFLHLEERNRDTAINLMSKAANKPLHLPDVRAEVSKDELRSYYDSTVNSERVVIWDHFGSNSIHEVLAKIRHMHNLGCKYIVLDHLSIIVSDQSGDERKQLDEICTKLKMLCMELNIAVIAVIHSNRQGQIRGSMGPEQLANIIIWLYRDKTDPDEWRRNVTKMVVEKNRFSGITGPGPYLYYEPSTAQLIELDAEAVKQYEDGGRGEVPWDIG